jgi:hypothetical protein
MIEYGGLFVVGGRLETISHNSPGRRGTTSKMKNPRTFCRADTSRVDESLPMTLVRISQHQRRISPHPLKHSQCFSLFRFGARGADNSLMCSSFQGRGEVERNCRTVCRERSPQRSAPLPRSSEFKWFRNSTLSVFPWC